MSTVGGFNSRNPTIKRILKEAAELSQPSHDLYAAPLENNLFEWHFTFRGPPSPSPFANGIYHGRISLPSEYPLRPPTFRFMTPSARFEVGNQICLSISGHHEETWQPAWGIRTALVALRSFMDSKAAGQVGGVDANDEVRERMAADSRTWRCAGCGKTNEEILAESGAAATASSSQAEEAIPAELRMAAKEELDREKAAASAAPVARTERAREETPIESRNRGLPSPAPTAPIAPRTDGVSTARQRGQVQTQPRLQLQQRRPQQQSRDDWLDKAIYGITVAIVVLVARKLLTFV